MVFLKLAEILYYSEEHLTQDCLPLELSLSCLHMALFLGKIMKQRTKERGFLTVRAVDAWVSLLLKSSSFFQVSMLLALASPVFLS